jgi:ABC-type glycerol-3-phosphate transport system substrate-binding protein
VSQNLKVAKRVPQRIGLLFLIVLAVCALCACGSAPATPTPGLAGPAATVTVPYELPVTLIFRGRFEPGELQALDEQITRFEQENPKIRVGVLEAQPGQEERRQAFTALLASGDTGTDLYGLDTAWLPEFEANRWLLRLDEYLPALSSDLRALLSDPVQGHRIEGQLVALSSPCLPDKALAISSHSQLPEQSFRFLVSLVQCSP